MNSPLLGIDLGKSRTGLAISENGSFATPLATLKHKTPHQSEIVSQLLEVIIDYSIKTLVIGIPLYQNDSESIQADWCKRIIQCLNNLLKEKQLDVEVITWNEFHSTIDAKQTYPNTDKDTAAATVILQQYLDESH